ncbi:unnamed protein product, partial [marine sediment metagenome]
CLSGQQHICAELKILGVDTDGCFAEYVAVPESLIWKNDPTLPLDIASVQEPLGNAIYCALVEPVAGKSVVVFGDGPTGLFAVGVAKASGASFIVLVGIDPLRMKIGKEMGADFIFHGRNDDVAQKVFDLTDGFGADVVLEMAGTEETISVGLHITRKGGRFCAFGLPSNKVTIDFNNDIIFKGITLYGINGRLMFDTWLKAKSLLKTGKLHIKPVITHHFPLTEFEKGFALLSSQPKGASKVILYPDPSKMHTS